MSDEKIDTDKGLAVRTDVRIVPSQNGKENITDLTTGTTTSTTNGTNITKGKGRKKSQSNITEEKESKVHLRGFGTMSLRDPDRLKEITTRGGYATHVAHPEIAASGLAKAREALLNKFATQEEKNEYFRSIGKKAAQTTARNRQDQREFIVELVSIVGEFVGYVESDFAAEDIRGTDTMERAYKMLELAAKTPGRN